MRDIEKNILLHLALSIAAIICMVLTSCEPQPDVYRIGVSQCNQDEWHQQMNTEMRRECRFLQGVTLEIRASKGDSETQIKDIKYFIDQKVDMLIISPNVANHEFDSIINVAIDAGIKVIETDRRSGNDRISAFIAPDNVSLGRKAGAYIANRLNYKGSIIELEGLTGSSSAQERHHGLMREFENTPDIKVLASIDAGWDEEKAFNITDSLMNIYTNIDLIVAHNDRMAKGAYRAAEKRNKEKYILFIGFEGLPGRRNGLENVERGVFDATFFVPSSGNKIIETAMQIRNKEPYLKNNLIESSLINKRNAYIIAEQAEQIRNYDAHIEQLSRLTDTYVERVKTQRHLLAFAICVAVLLCISIFAFYKFNTYKRKFNQRLATINTKLSNASYNMKKTNEELIKTNEDLEKATQSKLDFFTNVSHDIRTPLSLVESPVEQVIETCKLSKSNEKLLSIALKNVKVLKHLSNDILDFRKCDSHQMKLQYTYFNLSQDIEAWSDSFQQLAFKKHIHFTQDCSVANLMITADEFKLERIYYNLLSNAFKFTPENGHVNVRLRVLSIDKRACLRMDVSDSGCGIEPTHLAHVFENFYQTSIHPAGSGIGLALVKAFAELHNGSVSVISTPGKGSTFTLIIPMKPEKTDNVFYKEYKENEMEEKEEKPIVASAAAVPQTESVPAAKIQTGANMQERNQSASVSQTNDDNSITVISQPANGDNLDILDVQPVTPSEITRLDNQNSQSESFGNNVQNQANAESTENVDESIMTSHSSYHHKYPSYTGSDIDDDIPMDEIELDDDDLKSNFDIENDNSMDDDVSKPIRNSITIESGDKQTILLVDDNEDILEYTTTVLCDNYNIITAINGLEGLKVATKYLPDLIITDVMMPIMDGLEFCRRLKAETRTSHIPIIILTACATDDQNIAGFNAGADAYMSKPFNHRVLKVRIDSLLQNSRKLKAAIGSQVAIKTEVPKEVITEKDVMTRIKEVIEESMSDSSLSIDDICESVNLSRTQLYRKVKASTNYSPNELLRVIRLKKADELLNNSDMNISEIAYAVGFTSASYFSKCYKNYFGVLPNEKRS